MHVHMGLHRNRSRSWGASGRWFKSSRPDHLKAPERLGISETPGSSLFVVEGSHPTETLRRSEIDSNAAARVVLSEKLLTVREVAERLGVCRATVYAMVERGALPHVRIGNNVRFHPADLA